MKKSKIKPITWAPKKVEVKAIKATPNNYKIKTDLGKERLQQSLKMFGLAGTVIVNTDLTLIDGNSRLIEAKEAGEKYMYVSMPSRKLTPKEFQEMSAMYDYAKAGEVDIERIEGELGTTEDFFKKWGMTVPMHLLDKLGNKSVNVEDLSLSSNVKKNKEQIVGDVSDIRMVNLFFSAKQEAEFRKIEEKLMKKFKTSNTTDTVFKALKSIK